VPLRTEVLTDLQFHQRLRQHPHSVPQEIDVVLLAVVVTDFVSLTHVLGL
jgi:hypothetical protein